MRIGSAQVRATSGAQAIRMLAEKLGQGSLGRPDFLALHFAVGLDAADLHGAAKEAFGSGALHGGSSCLGIMGKDGVDIGGAGIGAFAIWDCEGSFGTASADLGDDAEAAVKATAQAALIAAGRPGEMPDLVWLTVAPGREEQVLAGLRAVVGAETLIIGGSAADNDVSGAWAQFGPEAVHADGVVVSVLFPSASVASVYQSGYAPTGASGVVTSVTGRRLQQIDGRAAANVYDEWTAGAVKPDGTEARSILAEATLWPLGRVARHVAGVPFHLLAHPAVSYPDGSIDLFADVEVGDRLWQMQGTADSLVARAGRVATQARADAGGNLAGALVIYCGGCMLAVRDRIDEVHSGVTAALGDVPWIGVYTFGEQGAPAGDVSRHGNLMISCTVFAE
ncbi:MAG: FIST C-terminal domain-containing protein [Rubellimicrobium sp.]|nr:FIST C-terminal domain-containing protein [Rubellimicrobium sp.]